MSTNQVLHGDAIKVAAALPAGAAHLVYLDPPFFSRRLRQNGAGLSYDDRWPGGMAAYLAFLRGLIDAAKPLLRPHGVLALHLDWRAAHWGRVELERAFSPDGFVNEIIWSYRTGGTSRRWLARKHDTIHVFGNGPDYVFNRGTEKSYLAHRYGFRNVRIRDDGDGPYTRVGFRDVWEIPALRGNMNEYTGYPTQKPLALLERLIECFTNRRGLVVDLCCGSGTALLAAKHLGRRWIGGDKSAAAVKLARARLSQ